MALVPVPEILRAEGLAIRRVHVSDLDTIHDAVLRNRDYLVPWVGAWIHREPVSREERRLEVDRWIEGYEANQAPALLIEEEGQFVGMVGLHDRNGPRDVEVGYWVDQACQRRGVATRATRALTTLALSHPDVERVLLRHLADNQPSRRIPEKLGFTLINGAERHDGRLFVLWAMTRTTAPS